MSDLAPHANAGLFLLVCIFGATVAAFVGASSRASAFGIGVLLGSGAALLAGFVVLAYLALAGETAENG